MTGRRSGRWPAHRSAVLDWLVFETQSEPFFDRLIVELARRLVAAGVPLDRITVHIRALHPLFFGATIGWQTGFEKAEIMYAGHEVLVDKRFLESPLKPLFNGEVGAIRQRLDIASPDTPRYNIYGDLHKLGMTDYVALPMLFVSGVVNVCTWATRRPGGFSTEDLAFINDLLPLLAMVIEIRLNRRNIKNVLETYVGKRAGERILAGEIRRGAGETVTAAIWICDIRGFTAMSGKLPRDRLINALNEYFDVMADAVTRHGGEILKFIGDAMLAIFPLDTPMACKRALDSAIDARTGMKELNERRKARGEEALEFGIALHAGDVMWGNVGAASRLDFTVIGPAVNLTVRMETLCKQVGCDILLSDTIAGMCEATSARVEPVGTYELRGIDRKVEIFRPVEMAA